MPRSRLYLALSMVCRCRVVDLRDELRDLAGLNDEQVTAGSIELATAGLVLCCADGMYHILNPATGTALGSVGGTNGPRAAERCARLQEAHARSEDFRD